MSLDGNDIHMSSNDDTPKMAAIDGTLMVGCCSAPNTMMHHRVLVARGRGYRA